MTDQAGPRVVVSGTPVDWKIHIVDVAGVASRIGEDTFAAFLKCFVGADQLKSLLHLYGFSLQQLQHHTPAAQRNRHVAFLLTVGTLHELGAALQELCNTKVFFKMADRTVWEPLDDLRAKWNTAPNSSTLRNQMGFHLGSLAAYRLGLEAIAKEAKPALLQKGQGSTELDDFFHLAWDALTRGVSAGGGRGQTDLDTEDFERIRSSTWDAHQRVYRALRLAFIHVLATAGVPIDNEVTEESPGDLQSVLAAAGPTDTKVSED
jgi:hypothetical protein